MKDKMTDELLKLYHMDTGVVFYHRNDERAFFEWLERIACFKGYEKRAGQGLTIRLKRKPKKDDLREIIALCFRYKIDMRQLKKFETAKNKQWFRDSDKYWYDHIFAAVAPQE